MKINYYNSKAYDICLGENDERLLQIYDVYYDSEEVDEPVLVSTTAADGNLEDLVMDCKQKGYKNIYEIFKMNQRFECDNILADSATSLFKSRFKILKKFYFPQIVNYKSYLMGGVIFVDMQSGKEYYIRTKNFGIENEMLIMYLEELGYTHIENTELRNIKEPIGLLPSSIKKASNLSR